MTTPLYTGSLIRQLHRLMLVSPHNQKHLVWSYGAERYDNKQPYTTLKSYCDGHCYLEKLNFESSSNCFLVNIASRPQWGAAAPRQKERLKGSAQRVVIHHTAFPSCKSLTECKDQLVSIQRMHMQERGFDDIGYK